MIRLLIPAIFLAAFVLMFATFTVNENEWAVRFNLGEIQRSDYEPGLHFKWPLVNNIRKFDNRILTVDEEPQRFLTREKKDVIVDSFVKWRISDPEVYYNATGGDERRAGLLIYQKVNDYLRSEFGKRTVKQVVSGERGEMMDLVLTRADNQAEELGVSIVDVRVQRIDLPEEVSDSVYRRMRAERERVARDFRFRGEEAAERIRASADRERTEILAVAYRDAEVTRGEGDAVATETYAKAYGKNEDFYSFYRRLNAYRSSFSNSNDVLLLEPDSDFFKFFKDPANQ